MASNSSNSLALTNKRRRMDEPDSQPEPPSGFLSNKVFNIFEQVFDARGNPRLSACATPLHTALAKIQPVRDVEWIRPPIFSPTQTAPRFAKVRLAASLAQRSGMQAPEGSECFQCSRGRGMFKACVIHYGFPDEGSPGQRGQLPRGSCMSCWYLTGIICSFRQTKWPLDSWYQRYLSGDEASNIDSSIFPEKSSGPEIDPSKTSNAKSQPKSSSPSVRTQRVRFATPETPETREKSPLNDPTLTRKPMDLGAAQEELSNAKSQPKSSFPSVRTQRVRFATSETREKSPLNDPTLTRKPMDLGAAQQELRAIQARIRDDVEKFKKLSLCVDEGVIDDDVSDGNNSTNQLLSGRETGDVDIGASHTSNNEDFGDASLGDVEENSEGGSFA